MRSSTQVNSGRSGDSAFGNLTRRIIEKSGRRRGFIQTELLIRWSSIIGPEISAHCCPEKLTDSAGRNFETEGATLTIRVDGGVAIELQHLEPQLIERINRYFGYAAVRKIKLVQGPLGDQPIKTRRQKKLLTHVERGSVATAVSEIHNSHLRDSLLSLGLGIASRH